MSCLGTRLLDFVFASLIFKNTPLDYMSHTHIFSGGKFAFLEKKSII